MPQDKLKASIEQLAAKGARDFYEGDLARSIAADVQGAGGALSVSDLAAFRAQLREPLKIPYRGGTVFATPELTAGPTLAHALRLLQQEYRPGRAPDAATYTKYAEAIQAAYRERLKGMGDAEGRRALGAEYLAPACTTHYSVVDRDGNMAAVTQTLLSGFGSRFVTPKTGITMNNGIMWFDPTQGTTNSLAPGKRCLCNYTPVVARGGGRPMARARRLRRTAHHALGDADPFLRDGLRHGPRRRDPPAADRRERRRHRDRRHAAAGGDARRPSAALRLRGSAGTDCARQIRLPERGAARGAPTTALRTHSSPGRRGES